jgi:hypothetical protein
VKKELSSQATTAVVAAVAILLLVVGYMWYSKSDTTGMGGMSASDRAQMADKMKQGREGKGRPGGGAPR